MRAPASWTWWSLAALAAGAALLTVAVLRQRRALPVSPRKPEDLSRWETEGGNAPPRDEAEAPAPTRRETRRTSH